MPAGRLGSTKPPVATGFQEVSNTSIVPALKLAAKKRGPSGVTAAAQPLYTAVAELSTVTSAALLLLGATRTEMVPSSVQNRKLGNGPPAAAAKLRPLPEIWPV